MKVVVTLTLASSASIEDPKVIKKIVESNVIQLISDSPLGVFVTGHTVEVIAP